MNLKTIGLAYTIANQAVKYFRDQNDKRERDIYDSLLENLKDGDLDDIRENLDRDQLEELFGTARAQAGDITRQAHERLDRRRAAFNADAPLRKQRIEFLEAHAKEKKDEGRGVLGTIGAVIKWTTLAAVAGGGAWAAWEFWLKDKFNAEEPVKTYRPAPTRTETDASGSSTLVYSTRTEDERSLNDDTTTDTTGKHALTTDATGGAATTASTASDDELTTLDTLDDDQRRATDATHNTDDSDGGRHELK